MQGGLGDCYLVASLAALSQVGEKTEGQNEIIRRILPSESLSSNNIYQVNIFYGGEPKEVFIDGNFPFKFETL